MNIREIKKEAEKIIDNKFLKIFGKILLLSMIPYLLIYNIQMIVIVIKLIFTSNYTMESSIMYNIKLIIEIILNFMISILIKNYFLNLSRNNNLSLAEIMKDGFKIVKKHWKQLFLGELIIFLSIILGYVMFIIPGIILSLGFAFYINVVIDSNGSERTIDLLKKTFNMMKGYKWNCFLLILSFILWILACFLLIPLIYALPYIETAMAVYYNKIKKEYDSKQIN